MPATKTAILTTFREELMRNAWASDERKLNAFMQAAWNTLHGANEISRTGPAWLHALEINGITKSKDRTLKALWALPE